MSEEVRTKRKYTKKSVEEKNRAAFRPKRPYTKKAKKAAAKKVVKKIAPKKAVKKTTKKAAKKVVKKTSSKKEINTFVQVNTKLINDLFASFRNKNVMRNIVADLVENLPAKSRTILFAKYGYSKMTEDDKVALKLGHRVASITKK